MMTHFAVSEEDLRKVLAAALEKGGDYADLFFETRRSTASGCWTGR
jgi:predicted Zn-dependent protease